MDTKILEKMKIGDKVRISSNKEDILLYYRGSEGIVVKIVSGKLSSCEKQECWIRIKDVSGVRWFCEDELEVIK